MGFLSILSCAHKWIEERVRPGDTVVDATVGNGVDTLFLARLVGRVGRVYGFDIQPQALDTARTRLERELDGSGGAQRVSLLLRSHADMADAVPDDCLGRTAAVMFNLGYLPGADPGVITVPASTLPALEAALLLLREGGILTIALYPGHDGGASEAQAVESWAAALPQEKWSVLCYRFINSAARSPYLIGIEKKKPRGVLK
ncbi:class I SAM-dependent methyltransferase [Paenibacillus chitinolyticus]|uniref:class I SAM-dependent methyltransferase n=1 Tax=Paenibacillus chitinolyticus TaxID=79263 RepID=UPI001C46F485|nr:class I SAM-dependent methyltransferase [Paenibacillus chitinolyticus]MBV6713522.1 methyltransferase domain-containing protein [Paenibacillus chitinolyticus]